MLNDLGRELMIRHFVNCFQFDGAEKLFALEPFEELTLGLTGANDEHRFRVTNISDYIVEEIPKLAH